MSKKTIYDIEKMSQKTGIPLEGISLFLDLEEKLLTTKKEVNEYKKRLKEAVTFEDFSKLRNLSKGNVILDKLYKKRVYQFVPIKLKKLKSSEEVYDFIRKFSYFSGLKELKLIAHERGCFLILKEARETTNPSELIELFGVCLFLARETDNGRKFEQTVFKKVVRCVQTDKDIERVCHLAIHNSQYCQDLGKELFYTYMMKKIAAIKSSNALKKIFISTTLNDVKYPNTDGSDPRLRVAILEKWISKTTTLKGLMDIYNIIISQVRYAGSHTDIKQETQMVIRALLRFFPCKK